MALVDVVLIAIGVFCLAVIFNSHSDSTDSASSLWLANGFALGILLTAPQARRPILLLAALLAQAASALYLRNDAAVIPWLALFNGIELSVATLALRSRVSRAEDLTVRTNFLRFLLYAVIIAPLAMVVPLGIFNLSTTRPIEPFALERIVLGHAMGMAIMTPVVLALRSGEVRRFLSSNTLLESALTLLLVGAVTAGVFYQSIAPLLFLVFPPMLRVAYRGGFVGTAMAMLLVVVISALATAAGHGPVAAARASGSLAGYPLLADGFLLLQIFFAALLMSLFPLIVSIAEGQRAHRATDELQNRLRLLMEHSSDVIILADLDGHRLYASPGVRNVLGIEPEEFLQRTWRDYMHELDQEAAGEQIREAQAARSSRTLTFRAKNASGAIVWVEAHMKYFRDRTFVLLSAEKDSGITRNCGPQGDEGFVVTLRDVSARRRAELELEGANAELASLIRKDSLTGLANRRRFDEVLQESWARALAGGWPIAVLMIDVDHFKQFNDAYGHQRGDFCLRDVANAIVSGLFHPDDVAARYGGEEFAVILPRTTTDNAALVAERIRRSVHDLRRPHVASPLGFITVSIGVASSFPVTHGDPLGVVHAADEALYTSKHEGRNRTTLLDVTWPARAPET